MRTAARRKGEASKYRWFVRITYKDGRVDETAACGWGAAATAADIWRTQPGVAKAELCEKKPRTWRQDAHGLYRPVVSPSDKCHKIEPRQAQLLLRLRRRAEECGDEEAGEPTDSQPGAQVGLMPDNPGAFL